MSSEVVGVNQSFEYPSILASFSIGKSNELEGETRWLHNMLKCFLSNPEYDDVRSFCFGYDSTSSRDLRAIGICIPKQCRSEKVKLLKLWSIITTKKPIIISRAACINSKHDRPWYIGFAPLTQMLLCGLFTTVIAVSTKYHSKLENSSILKANPSVDNSCIDPKSFFFFTFVIRICCALEFVSSLMEQVLFAFSLKRNLYKLAEFPKYPHSTITCMFGLRFLSMVWTLIGHSFAWVQDAFIGYVDNVDEFRYHLTSSVWNILITNFNLTVDTFFVISATLTSYTWFLRLLQKRGLDCPPTWSNWRYWLVFYRHRLFRIWPAYLLSLSLITFFFTELHTHPMWPPIDPSVQCRRYGWQNIVFLNSLTGNNCMGWTWLVTERIRKLYISTEFIFYLCSPIFLMALKNSPQMGWPFCVALIFASCSLKLNVMINKNYPPIPLHLGTSKFYSGTFMEYLFITLIQVDDYYIKPQYRIGPYIIGLLLGQVLAIYQNSKNKINFSSKAQYLGWLACLALGSWSLFGAYPTMKDMNFPLLNLIYGFTHRISWALSVSWIIYACHTGIGGFINDLLSFRYFVPLSSLCYSVYLMHLLIVFAIFMWSPFPIIFSSKVPILLMALPQLVLSYLAAAMISMYAEFPALNLEKLFFAKASSSKAAAAAAVAAATIANSNKSDGYAKQYIRREKNNNQ
uniref:Acyl_transf_3 domain-containing protein n=1 Tax=Syphacia muris TaxID=451379 RepID=A0A0N5AVL3_9BILA